jgi:hypothetical protein
VATSEMERIFLQLGFVREVADDNNVSNLTTQFVETCRYVSPLRRAVLLRANSFRKQKANNITNGALPAFGSRLTFCRLTL